MSYVVRSASRSSFFLSVIPRVKPEGMLFGKLDSTRRVKARGQAFPDHALMTLRASPRHFQQNRRRCCRPQRRKTCGHAAGVIEGAQEIGKPILDG